VGIRHGGRDGKPGLRADYGANDYAAFVTDPDCYRIEAHPDRAAYLFERGLLISKLGASEMAAIRKEISTKARTEDVWNAVRDIGALHTRLVPGFVINTRLEPGARIVRFGNGMEVRELIVTIDEGERRLVWSAVGGSLTHHNGSVQVFLNAPGPTTVVWIADFLPDEAASIIGAMMEQGATIMKQTLDRLADDGQQGTRD
jgi:hypothetical protein